MSTMSDVTKQTITVATACAVAISICGGAFMTGIYAERLRSEVTAVQVAQMETDAKVKEQERVTNEWRNKTTEILNELKILTRDNKMRLDLERKQ